MLTVIKNWIRAGGGSTIFIIGLILTLILDALGIEVVMVFVRISVVIVLGMAITFIIREELPEDE